MAWRNTTFDNSSSSNLGNLSSLELLELDSDTGLCLAADFPLETAFGRLAQELGLTLCDTTSPTVTITSVASEPVADPFPVTVNFSERVTGFELADLVVGNGSASELQGDGAGYTATVIPAASGTVTVDIAAGAAEDSAGNPSAAADQFSITADLTPVPALPLAGAIVLALLLIRGARQRAART